MRTLVEADLKTCFMSMVTGFAVNVILVLGFDVGWVEAPIIAGLAGSVVYVAMGLAANSWKRVPAVE
jgi:sodium/proline symporter